jgi:hypothetical protein
MGFPRRNSGPHSRRHSACPTDCSQHPRSGERKPDSRSDRDDHRPASPAGRQRHSAVGHGGAVEGRDVAGRVARISGSADLLCRGQRGQVGSALEAMSREHGNRPQHRDHRCADQQRGAAEDPHCCRSAVIRRSAGRPPVHDWAPGSAPGSMAVAAVSATVTGGRPGSDGTLS